MDGTGEEDGYCTCVQVDTYDQIPEGMVNITVNAQKYATIRHECILVVLKSFQY